MTNFALKATNYAKNVVNGNIVACHLVRCACQRHLDDLARSKEKSFPYKFDREKADRVCIFASSMIHVKGREWAGKEVTLEPWQIFILCSVFGWVKKRDGMRRFREIYAEIPRKNGKSLLGAIIGLYMFCADGEPGAEIYAGATKLSQAKIVFDTAKQMCIGNPDFVKHFGIGIGAENLHILSSGSKFEPVVAKPGDGSSPHCAIIDEYHEHTTSVLYDTMSTGMGARVQPLLSIITTAGENISGPCYVKHTEVVKILKGVVENDNLFGIIYSIDDGDDWTSEIAWKKANPNFGVSIYTDQIEFELKKAITTTDRRNIFKSKHLNIWTKSSGAWIDIEKWKECEAEICMEDFKEDKCWVGLDFAAYYDLTAMMFVFLRNDEFYVFGKYYLPEDTVNRPENTHFQSWVQEGIITSTPGACTDFDVIQEDLLEIAEQYNIQEIAYDPWGLNTPMGKLREVVPFPCIEIRQCAANISEPSKYFEGLYLAGKLHHNGDPCLTWQASNVVLRRTNTKTYAPAKERKQDKIDGIVAMIMALSRASLHTNAVSVYESRGFFEI